MLAPPLEAPLSPEERLHLLHALEEERFPFLLLRTSDLLGLFANGMGRKSGQGVASALKPGNVDKCPTLVQL